MTFPKIDLISDTVTRPTPEMRRFMSEAEVGDEQNGEDPTVNQLTEMVADMLGKEAAVYLPSGTMCNEIAFAVHCRAGDEIIMDQTAHPLNYEAGGPAVLSGALIRPLQGSRGIFTAAQLEGAIRSESRYHPRSSVVSIEQTSNLGGGAIWPLETIRAVCDLAHQHQLITHMDGARLFNAVVASGISAKEYAASFDSLWVDFSKGLGAPVGSVLAGSEEFIEAAWRWKQRIGGAMRQAGIIAAGCVYALRHHIDRLAEDHENAKRLAYGLAECRGIDLDPGQIETNIVLFDVGKSGFTASEIADRILEYGVRFSVMDKTLLRAVTHLDITGRDIEEAIEVTRKVMKEIVK
ncbi:MAG: threonine aldolase family protein [Candidatus Tectomicrobia bacterium]|nr:threonine aldolase family protein [Candidatus Tectomicrobia bacterium]